MISSYEYLEVLAPKITDELVICTIAGISMEWKHLNHRDGNLYHVYMTGTTAFALGLALSLPHRRVISFDGDGSMLMGLSLLPVIGQLNPSNLIVIVFDNELYEATGNTSTATAGKADLVKMAQGAGIANTSLVEDLMDFEQTIDKAFKADGTSFITAKARAPREPRASLKEVYGNIENKYCFIRYIEQTENMQILRPEGS